MQDRSKINTDIFASSTDIIETNQLYPLMEHFYTVQGEGFWAGTPAYFIRLGGCDVGCFWCDVKESWDENNHPKVRIEEILKPISESFAKRIVITGGEPLLHNLNELTTALKIKGYILHLETSGVHPLTGNFDWICLSPKKFKNVKAEIFDYIHELKIVVYNKHDLEWAESFVSLCKKETHLFLQPEWSRKESPKWIIEYIKDHPHWRISLQTHKYLEIP